MKKFSVICCLVLLLLLVGGQVSALVTVVAEEIVEEPIGNYEEELNEKLEEDTKEIEEDIVTEEITVEPEEKPVEQVPMKEMRDVFDEVNANGVAEEKSKLTVENALISSYTKEKLGYQARSVVSWSVPASLSHYGDDMMGSASHLKYSGTTKIEKKISALSPDGTIRLDFNPLSKEASLTRLKNQPTILESGKGLSYSFSATYAYRTWKKVIAWVQVEDRYGTVNPAGKITGIELEAPVDLLATTNSSMNELEQDSQFIGLPEEFVIVTQQMVGGNLAFEWIKKPDTSVLGPQTAKVKVTNILGGYKNTIEVTIPITVREKGSVSVQAPEMLEFQDYQIQNSDTIVERKQDDWNLVVEDTRHPNNQENEGWSLTAKAEDSVSGLEKYLVFIDEENQEYSLLEETLIFTSVLQQTENTLINWADNRGILLKIPKNNDLQPNQQYQTTITWNINEGP